MDGWQTRAIGEVFKVVNGGTPKTGAAEFWGGPHQWITPAEMGGLASPYLSQSRRTLTDEGLRVGAELVPANSIIVSTRAPIGHLVINEVEMAFNQGCKGLVPSCGIDTKFAYYFLLANVPVLESLGTGATFKELSGSKLKEVPFRFPSLSDQCRIVAILDEAFEAIATAKANAEKNLQNAREWVAGQLTTVLETASANGKSGTLETLVAPNCTLSYGIVQPGDDVPGGLPVVRPVDLGDKVVYAEGLKRIDPILARSYTRTTLKGGDLLLCVRGTTGTVAVADQALAGANVTRGIVPIRFDPGTVSQALGYYLMRSQSVQAQIRAKTYGTALMQINIGDLRQIVVRFPPLEGQAALVERLDAIQEAADQLIDVYERKLAALDELKQSLLHQAFTGQLSAGGGIPTRAAQPAQASSAQFAAAIISLAHERHRRRQRERTFGHVKQQKLLHLVEALTGLDLGRQPMKDAAGPNDFPHQLRVDAWARQNGFYDVCQRDDGGYDFKRLSGFDKLLAEAPQVLGSSLGAIESVIDLLVPMDSQEAELLATVHAAWNNLLIDGAEVTDEAIVREARDTWHPDKLKIPEPKFHQTIALIRSKGLVPVGGGKYVGGQERLL